MKLNKKFGIISILFFVFTSSILGGVYLMQQLQKTDGAIIDASGRDRMLSQRIGFYAEQILNEDESAKQTLKEIIGLHHVSFYALKDGGIAPGIAEDRILPSTIPSIMPIVLEAEELWVQYKKNAEIIVNEDTFIRGEINPVVSDAMIFIEKNGPEMLRRNNEMVKAYVKENDQKRNNFNYVLIGFFIISFLGAILMSRMSKKISDPINELHKVAIAIQGKDFSKKVTINTGDELETLGEAFNNATEALDRMEKDRAQVDKAKTEFLSITSHELRSPMTPMRAQLQMLIGNYFGKLTKKQRNSLDIVLRNTKRLDGIIVDFLEISRIEAARLKFDFQKESPNNTIKDIIEEMKGFLPEKNIKLVNKSEKIISFEHDPNRLGQILRNLINNAMKFTPENGTIEIGANKKGKEILFYVKDTGIGIPTDNQIRLFEPFYQVDNMYQHKTGGTGLGLAICRGIVESQKGKIWVESKERKGTIFRFTIPTTPTKKISPIKLLFSEKEDISIKIKELFGDLLGPLGETEFKELQSKKSLNEKELLVYIKSLKHKKVLTEEKADIFKRKILKLFRKSEKVYSKTRSKKIEKDVESFFK